jgi:hypothetical protein
MERKIHVGYNAFAIPSTYDYKELLYRRVISFFEVKDDNGDDDNDDSGNIIFISSSSTVKKIIPF